MWIRKRSYYYAYDIFLKNDKIIHGSGTSTCKGLPKIESWMSEIKELTESTGLEITNIQVLSCIPVNKDFIK